MHFDYVIIGAGISGVTTAFELSRRGVKDVLLIEHQDRVGGFTRAYHPTGNFAVERALFDRIDELTYPIWLSSTVIGFFPDEEGKSHQLYVQTPDETKTVNAKKVIIASGAMEKPREGVGIPGSRPAGVMTPLMVTALADRDYKIGEKIVVVGTNRVTESLIDLLGRDSNIQHIGDKDFELLGINGLNRVESIVLKNKKDRSVSTVACDTLVYGNGKVPSTFFLKGTEVKRNQDLEVEVDDHGRTNIPGVFAVGSATQLGAPDHSNSIALAKQIIPHLLQDSLKL